MSKKKTALVAGIITGFAALWGIAGFVYLNRTTPEELLYAYMLEKMPEENFGYEQSMATNELLGKGSAKLSGYTYVHLDGKVRTEGKLVCENHSETSGNTKLETTIRQVDSKLYMKIDNIEQSATGDDAYDSQAEKLAEVMSGKWVLVESKDHRFAGYKERGVLFSWTGAYSKKMDARQVADILKEEKAITILETKDTKYGGQPTTEYKLRINRTAYENFMDRVDPGFPYKSQILELLFDDENQTITTVIDKQSRLAVQSGYSIDNPCIDHLSMVGADTSNAPRRVQISAVTKENKDIKNLKDPADAINLLQFVNLIGKALQGEDAPQEAEIYENEQSALFT